MATVDFSFTSTLEIENFTDGEYPVTICGYVDYVGQPLLVGNPKRYLMKCELNNGDGTRLRVLFWGKQTTNHQNKIVKRLILHITVGRINEAAPLYFKPEEGLSKMEFYVTPQSVISFGGLYEIPEIAVSEVDRPAVKEVALEDCINEEGLIGIEAYVKEPFITIDNQNSSFGLGVIMKNNYKLSVQIIRFREDQKLPVGAHIHLEGKFSLTRNMRSLPEEIEFAQFLISIGDGTVNDCHDNIELPEQCIADPEEDIVKSIYGDLIDNHRYSDLSKVAILSARNADVDEINARVVELLDKTTERIYTSIYSVYNCNNGDISEAILPEYPKSL